MFSQAPPQGAGPMRSQILRVFFIYAYTLWLRTTNFDVVTHMGNMDLFLGSATPSYRGGGVSALSNFGGPFYSCVHSLSQNHQIWRGVVTHVGEIRVSWGQSRQAHIPRELRSSSAHRFLEFCFRAYLHSLTQTDQIRHGNTYWVFNRSVTPLYLHKASRGLSATAELLVVYEGLPARSHTHAWRLVWHHTHGTTTN